MVAVLPEKRSNKYYIYSSILKVVDEETILYYPTLPPWKHYNNLWHLINLRYHYNSLLGINSKMIVAVEN